MGQPPAPVGDPDFRGVSLPVSDNHEEKYGLPPLDALGELSHLVSRSTSVLSIYLRLNELFMLESSTSGIYSNPE